LGIDLFFDPMSNSIVVDVLFSSALPIIVFLVVLLRVLL
jgi:hypothetical protein